MNPAEASLARRVREHAGRHGLLGDGGVLVALSGGLDSLVLLHLLRFGEVGGGPLRAAHLDHGMRAASRRDALWVRGLARAWEVPLVLGRADPTPASEEEAREARYAFLEDARREAGSAVVATAHHADDQAETVLFRVLRGTGVRGLRGIPERRGSVVRPLLRIPRSELAGYAARAGIVPRPDPSNADPRFARNVLRHEILPRAEEAVAPGARAALVRLSRIAAREEEAWEALLPDLLDRVLVEARDTRIVVALPGFLAYPQAVRARVLREIARRLGFGLDHAGTRAALEFTTVGASGRRHRLPGGRWLAREFDRLVVSAEVDERPGGSLLVRDPTPGEARVCLGGRDFRVEWSGDEIPGMAWTEAFATRDLAFPLLLGSRSPGDRIRLSYGTKKVKKLLAEARVPAGERAAVPVLKDRRGRVLWVAGVARTTAEVAAREGEETFHIGVEDADSH